MQQQLLFKDLAQIIKEGWLEKQSRFLKKWKKRWFVLTKTTLYTFETETKKTAPTELIFVKDIATVKSSEEETKRENSFKIENHECGFLITAADKSVKDEWMAALAKVIVQARNC